MKINSLVHLSVLLSLTVLFFSCNLDKVEEGNVAQFRTLLGGGGDETPLDVINTSDGGFVVVGSTSSFGNGLQAYISKLDKDGNLEWERNFGGVLEDGAVAVTATSDGGYVFCGSTTNAGFESDAYFVKVNAEGSTVWEKKIGVADSTEIAMGIVPIGSGDFLIGYLAVGSNDRLQLLRINSNGVKVSDKFVRSLDFQPNKMIKTSDGKIVFAGSEYGAGTVSYILKTTETGSYIWENRYPTVPDNYTPGYDVVEMPDKSLVLAGSDLGGNTSDHDFNIVSFSEPGGFQFDEFWGGASADELYDIALSKDNELVVMGYSWSFSGTAEFYLSKRKATDGSKIWEKHFEPISAAYGCMSACSDGGFVVCGVTGGDIVVIKTDTEGNF